MKGSLAIAYVGVIAASGALVDAANKVTDFELGKGLVMGAVAGSLISLLLAWDILRQKRSKKNQSLIEASSESGLNRILQSEKEENKKALADTFFVVSVAVVSGLFVGIVGAGVITNSSIESLQWAKAPLVDSILSFFLAITARFTVERVHRGALLRAAVKRAGLEIE